MTEAVLDASAVLALLNGEPGGEAILHYGKPLICAVNHSEVVGRLTDWGLDDVSIDAALRKLAYQIEPFDAHRAFIAARLRRQALRSLSLGDRACLALAMTRGLPVLTADRAWSTLELGVDVRLIR